MRRLVKIPHGGTVLDAGCGPGHILVELAREHPDVSFRAYDTDVGQLFEAHPDGVPPNVVVESVDLTQLDERDLYDYIITMHTLEHIPENRRVLENLCRALKPGGAIYVDVPYRAGQYQFLPRRWLGEVDRWAEKHHTGPQYSLPELEELMRGIGFEIITGMHSSGPLGRFAWEVDRVVAGHLWLRCLLAPALKALAWLDPLLPKRRGNVIVIGRKPASADDG